MSKRGKIYPSKSLILRVDCGAADDGSQTYKMSTTMTGEPIIESGSTGKYFVLRWQDIIEMAIEAGIDNEEQAEEREVAA